jgi:hypothetical protein
MGTAKFSIAGSFFVGQSKILAEKLRGQKDEQAKDRQENG